MGPDRTDRQDHPEDPADLVVHHNKDHLAQVLVNTGRPACNSTVVRPDRQVRDLRVVHLDIPVDLRVILEEHNHDQSGTDHQECITGHRDHQVSLNINICKVRNLVKAHHREDLLQVLWVVQEGHPRVMEDHHKDRHKGLPEDPRLTSIRRSSLKDLLISILASILRDHRVHLTDLLMGHHTGLRMVHRMDRPMDNPMVRLMYHLTVMVHPLHSHRMVRQGLITARKALRH